jgi:hypothetical protein
MDDTPGVTVEGDWDGFFQRLEAGEHARYYAHCEQTAQANLRAELRREWDMDGTLLGPWHPAPDVVDAA